MFVLMLGLTFLWYIIRVSSCWYGMEMSMFWVSLGGQIGELVNVVASLVLVRRDASWICAMKEYFSFGDIRCIHSRRFP